MKIAVLEEMNFRTLKGNDYEFNGKKGTSYKAKFEDDEGETHVFKVRESDLEKFKDLLEKNVDYQLISELRIYSGKPSLYLLEASVFKN